MELDSEPYILQQELDPKIRLAEYGVSNEEMEFLIGTQGRSAKGVCWGATRVELNAMTSVQFISWLERKLIENGVEKLVPGVDVIGPMWQERQKEIAYDEYLITDGEQVRILEVQLEEAKAELEKTFDAQYKPPQTPSDLQDQVMRHLCLNPVSPWDTALAQIAGLRH
jgi:hypothetical protein